MSKVLLLEDDVNLRLSLADEFLERGYTVFQTDSVKNIKAEHYDYAVLDLRLKNERGIDAIDLVLGFNNKCRIVILTGFGSIATSVEAIKLGAINYLTKPVSFDELENVLLNDQVESAEEKARLSLSEHEYEYIQFVLNQNNGNITRAAKELGLHRQSLQRKLKKLP